MSKKSSALFPGCGRSAAHANARFTVSAEKCPSIDERWEEPSGVPLSAIIFGGRRADTVPLVFQSESWESGVYWAATIGSETTAAATGDVGVVRRDPMAMLPFAGYNMGNYFKHWLGMTKRTSVLPKIFIVNWFRKDANGKFIWPGYGQNMRVLKWIFNRVDNKASAHRHVLGDSPNHEDLDWTGLDFSSEQYHRAMNLDVRQWHQELSSHKEFFLKFDSKLPIEFINQQERMHLHFQKIIDVSSPS